MENPVPPPIQTNYPRPDMGSLVEFESLMSAFKVTSRAFLFCILVNICSFATQTAVAKQGYAALVVFGIGFIGLSALCVWSARTYAAATGKNVTGATIFGLFAPAIPCMVLVGTAVMQQELIGRIKKQYNIRYGFMGFKKSDVEALRARLNSP
ncbi:MAG: hypothetical protein ABUL49_00765 [bacterium]